MAERRRGLELTALTKISSHDGWVRLRGPAGAANLLRWQEARRLVAEAEPRGFDLPSWELHDELAADLRRKGVDVADGGSVKHLSPRAWSFSSERAPENFLSLARAFEVLGMQIDGIAVPDDLLPFLERHGQRVAHLELQPMLEALDLLTCYREEGFAILPRRT